MATPEFMGFSLTSPAPEKSEPTAKNRVWGFFGDTQQSHRENCHQPKQPRQGNPPSLTKIGKNGVRVQKLTGEKWGQKNGVRVQKLTGKNGSEKWGQGAKIDREKWGQEVTV